MPFRIRRAETRDIPWLRQLIETSVRGLQAADYSAAQIDAALRLVYGVDTQLIADGTYFAAEATESPQLPALVGCGGWSRRQTLYGGDRWKEHRGKEDCGKEDRGKELGAGSDDSLLDPVQDAAKICAFFVHPAWARRGIGGLILEACEQAAYAAGFRRLEMAATLTGVPFYRAKGYVEMDRTEVPLGDGLKLPIVRMGKSRSR